MAYEDWLEQPRPDPRGRVGYEVMREDDERPIGANVAQAAMAKGAVLGGHADPAENRRRLEKEYDETKKRVESARESLFGDPWKHRSEGMRCKTCMWFAAKRPDVAIQGAAIGSVRSFDVGRCRRHAPTINGYPVVFVNDWCGDHKLNENAL